MTSKHRGLTAQPAGRTALWQASNPVQALSDALPCLAECQARGGQSHYDESSTGGSGGKRAIRCSTMRAGNAAWSSLAGCGGNNLLTREVFKPT